MKRITHQQRVDALINQFWREGYLTLSRKYGTYLPSPGRVGNYDIDAIGKYKKKFVLGLTLESKDFNDPKLFQKIKYLSSRNAKYSNKPVKLYVGIPKEFITKFSELLQKLPQENKENIKVITLSD